MTPADVSNEVLSVFLAWATDRTLTRHPRKLAGQVRIVWNQACARIANWPGQALSPLPNLRPFIRPLAAFPASFQADVAAFGQRLTTPLLDPLDEDVTGPDVDEDPSAPLTCPRPVRASTAALRMTYLRWAASALVDSGMPAEAITTLRDLVTPLTHAKAILRQLYEAAGNKPSARGMHVAEVLLMVGKYHARLPKTDIDRLRVWAKRVTLVYTGMTEKNQARMRQALVPAREQKLGALPEALMRAAQALRHKQPHLACSRAMTATAIKLFSRRMLRLANVCNLRLDRHVQRADPRRSLPTAIFIPAEEAKTRRAISLPLAPDIGRMLEEWIQDFRPIIAAPDSPYLFPGFRDGSRPITPQGLRLAIKKVTKAHAGVELSPHQFRHLAAHTFLEEYPGHYEEVRQQLGHSSLVVTVRHYSGTQTDAAMRRYDDAILKRRNRRTSSPKTAKRSRRSAKGSER